MSFIFINFFANFFAIIVLAITSDLYKSRLARYFAHKHNELDIKATENSIFLINTMFLAFFAAINSFALREGSFHLLTVVGYGYLIYLLFALVVIISKHKPEQTASNYSACETHNSKTNTSLP